MDEYSDLNPLPETNNPFTIELANGTIVCISPPETFDLPSLIPSVVISEYSSSTKWSLGRAGMKYRDLIPDRLGGRYIASHINIPTGGPVPDYVHYHQVRFQMIYCYRGRVRVVYEDQGDPFYLESGDCVIQPPEIRHRVLESSDDLHVVEIGCPAIHKTIADFNLDLPNCTLNKARTWNNQNFVHFISQNVDWQSISDFRIWSPFAEEKSSSCISTQWMMKNTGVLEGTHGLADVIILRAKSSSKSSQIHHDEFCFLFILSGQIELEILETTHFLSEGSSVTIPAETVFVITACEMTQILRVILCDK